MFSYAITGGDDAALFDIQSGNVLVLVNAGQSGTPLQVTVEATDGAMLTFSKSFNITEGVDSLHLTPVSLDAVTTEQSVLHYPLAHGDWCVCVSAMCLRVRSRSTVQVDPTDISLSSLTYTPPLAMGTLIGTLSTVDGNCCQSHTYSIVGGNSSSLFSISGDGLYCNTVGLTGNGLEVEVQTSDGAGGLFSKTFVVDEGFVGIAQSDLCTNGTCVAALCRLIPWPFFLVRHFLQLMFPPPTSPSRPRLTPHPPRLLTFVSHC